MARAPRSKPAETKSSLLQALEIKMKFPAIYQIKNRIDGKVYVGSAKDFHIRKLKHLNHLKHGKHHCTHLQNAWTLYGEANFEFSVLEIISNIALLAEREQYWMDLTNCSDRASGYNILPRARTHYGSKRTHEQRLNIAVSQKGVKRSEQARINMSLCRFGKTHTEEAKARMSKAGRNRSRWSCPDGSRCKCDVCLPIRRMERKQYYKRYYAKTKNLFGQALKIS